MRGGVRRLIAREVEDAVIHRRDRDEGFLARRDVPNLDRQAQRAARADEWRRAEIERELALIRADREPGEAQCAAGHALLLGIERAMRQGHEIGTGAPIRRDFRRIFAPSAGRSTVSKCATRSEITAIVALPARAG